MTETIPSAGKTTGSLNGDYGATKPSFGQLILDRVAESGAAEAFRAPKGEDGWQSFTWNEIYENASEAAAGLVALGVGLEDRVAIASNTRLEWIVADFAVMLSGGAVTTVYPSTGEEDVGYILGDSDSVVVVCEDAGQAEKAQSQRANLPHLKYIVLIDGSGNGDDVLSWDDLRAKGREQLAQNPNLIQERVDQTGPDNLSTLIYTSGTTGKPKGVELTHGNWTYESAAILALDVFHPADVQFLWLPLAHSFGKVLIGAHLQAGGVTVVDGRIPKIVENLPTIQPTLMAAVPRIFEKVYAGVNATAKEGGGAKASIFEWAFRVGDKAYEKKAAGEPVGGLLNMQLNLADRLVFSKVRDRLGGKLRYFVSGSAALSKDINKWFDILGLPILEGYGLTETSAATSVNRPTTRKPGTVGEPLPGTEIKIAESDGEILIRGPGVMRGYRNRPDANDEAFGDQEPGPNRWFASGDIGVIDEAGRVKITDRKKDLVKTSGGKYIATGAMESQFKAAVPVAGQVVVIANERNFVSALVALDPDAAKAWADANSKSADFATLAKDPDLIAHVQTGVDQLNGTLNRWETVKQFRIIPQELTVDDGFLTPSLKTKRKPIEQAFSGLVDDIYKGA